MTELELVKGAFLIAVILAAIVFTTLIIIIIGYERENKVLRYRNRRLRTNIEAENRKFLEY